MLISPFEVQAVARGFNVLGVASEMFGAYQGLVAGVRQAWARQHKHELEGYIRAYVQAVEWLYDPANRDEALAILEKHMPNTTPKSAQTAYGILLDPKTGIQRKAAIDMQGMKEVLKLRSKWGQPKRELTDPTKYYDASFYEAALKH